MRAIASQMGLLVKTEPQKQAETAVIINTVVAINNLSKIHIRKHSETADFHPAEHTALILILLLQKKELNDISTRKHQCVRLR